MCDESLTAFIVQHRNYSVLSKPHKVKSHFGKLACLCSGFGSDDHLYHLRVPHANCGCDSRIFGQLVDGMMESRLVAYVPIYHS